MWPRSMHGSLIWKDCVLLGSLEGTNLPKGWLQAYFSSSTMQPAHLQVKSWGTPLVFCAGFSISIRQDTDIINNVPAVTRDPMLHGHVQCIKNTGKPTNK